MGKRIPKSRRHKKLKFVDPNYRGPQPRTKKKHLQFNEPPAKDDEQEVPHDMKEFINLKNKVKEGKIKKRRKKKPAYKNDFIVVRNQIVDKNDPCAKNISPKIPKVLKQNKTEDEQQFINRLQRMADKALAEAKVEEKYNIKLVNIDKEGNAVYKSLDEENSEGRKKLKRKRYREKLQEKKRLKVDDKEFEFKREHIPFGDVVEAPPNLSTKPRISFAFSSKVDTKPHEGQSNSSPVTKWKDLTADRRKELEHERARAVQMYRLLKNKKL